MRAEGPEMNERTHPTLTGSHRMNRSFPEQLFACRHWVLRYIPYMYKMTAIISTYPKNTQLCQVKIEVISICPIRNFVMKHLKNNNKLQNKVKSSW